jgi:hypothetical protein
LVPAETLGRRCGTMRAYGRRILSLRRGHDLGGHRSARAHVLQLFDLPPDRRAVVKSLDLHRCATCGCISHWSPVDPALDRMGVNARLMDPAIVAAARVRRFDGAETWKFLE